MRRASENIRRDPLQGAPARQSAKSTVDVYVDEAISWLPEFNALPRAESAPGASLALDAAAIRASTSILVVDDSADILRYMTRLLAPHYHVTAVTNGSAALAALSERLPDLVLSDVVMPALNGFGLLAAIRSNALTRAVPVILLSARANLDAPVDSASANADDYLLKPFSARELLARVQKQLELARSRKQWSDELKLANEELTAFSYSVAHDLRAPLRAIEGFSAAIFARYADQFDEEGRSYFERVRKAASRMSALIDDLLSLSRISQTPVQRELIDLTSLAQIVARDLSEREPTRNVQFIIQHGLRANGDPNLLRIVLENLLANSWKFTGPRESARITVGQLPDSSPPTFFVSDDGIGFDPAHRHLLFQAFQRLHSNAALTGSGIGLHIVGRIVSRHGGRVWAEGLVARGATFSFTLGEAS